MTELIWFTVADPVGMLIWVGPRCSERKLRLFAAACCRRVAGYCRPRFEATVAEAEAAADPSSLQDPDAATIRSRRQFRRPKA